MAKGVVDLLHPIQIKREHGKSPSGAEGTLDFGFEFLAQSAVVGQTSQRIGRREMAQMIFRGALRGDVLGDDFAAALSPRITCHLPAAEPDSHSRSVLTLPFHFDEIYVTRLPIGFKQLSALDRIA